METGQERKHTGGPLALAAAALFGASTPIAKLLLGVTDPLLLAGSGGGLAVVSVIGRARSRNHTEAPLRRADLAWLAAVVLFGGILGPALLVWGLVVIPASAASLLLNVEALATMAIAWIVFRENVDRRIFAGAMAILAGARGRPRMARGVAHPRRCGRNADHPSRPDVALGCRRDRWRARGAVTAYRRRWRARHRKY